MEKVLIVEPEKCTGCKVCEIICSMERTGEYRLQDSCIRILRNMELDVNIPAVDATCDFCGKCTQWCFQGAIRFVDYEEAALIRKDVKLGAFPAPVLATTR